MHRWRWWLPQRRVGGDAPPAAFALRDGGPADGIVITDPLTGLPVKLVPAEVEGSPGEILLVREVVAVQLQRANAECIWRWVALCIPKKVAAAAGGDLQCVR